MGTLRQNALDYEPQQTLNISDLDVVPLDLIVYEQEGKDQDGKPFKFKYLELNEKKYRVPNSVFEEIQTIIKLKPEVQKVRVRKSGSGMATRYKVEPVL